MKQGILALITSVGLFNLELPNKAENRRVGKIKKSRGAFPKQAFKKRSTIVKIHIIASLIATLTILTFFSSTIIIEFWGSVDQLVLLKERIFFALPLLLLSMPIVGISGKWLAGSSKAPLLQKKMKRMKLIASNGGMLTILACLLYYLSRDSQVSTGFYILQTMELTLGAINLCLIGLSLRDGMFLSGRHTLLMDGHPVR